MLSKNDYYFSLGGLPFRLFDWKLVFNLRSKIQSCLKRPSVAYQAIRTEWTGIRTAGATEGVNSRVAEVRIQESESIESALRRFKRKVQQEDIIKDIKKHSFYLKPGDKRRAKQALALKRSRKKMRRDGD